MDKQRDPLADSNRPDGDVPDAAFVDQVRQLLSRLHDLPYLQSHPLVQPGLPAEPTAELAGQSLRRILVSAIESLSPGPGVPFRAPHARVYNLLHLHYVEGMTVQEAAHELSISGRQAYRDLRHAEESVAAVLWDRYIRPRNPSPPPARHPSSRQDELARLDTRPHPRDLRSLVGRALGAVDRLAQARQVTIVSDMPDEPAMVLTDATAGPQVMVSLLSHAVQQVEGGQIRLTLVSAADSVMLRIACSAPRRPLATSLIDEVVAELIDRMGWQIVCDADAGGGQTISLRMPRDCPSVLVIDDNEGMADLLERFLGHNVCRVIQVTSSLEGQQIAIESAPSAIILDVMMPRTDGWQVLQTLRNHPATMDIPIVVCSVLNDPELAYSLGASLFLPKPISRDALLESLRQMRVL